MRLLVLLVLLSLAVASCEGFFDPPALREAQVLRRSVLPGHEAVDEHAAEGLVSIGYYLMESLDGFVVVPEDAERRDRIDHPERGLRGIAEWSVTGPSGSDCFVFEDEVTEPRQWAARVNDDAVVARIERGEAYLIRLAAGCSDH